MLSASVAEPKVGAESTGHRACWDQQVLKVEDADSGGCWRRHTDERQRCEAGRQAACQDLRRQTGELSSLKEALQAVQQPLADLTAAAPSLRPGAERLGDVISQINQHMKGVIHAFASFSCPESLRSQL